MKASWTIIGAIAIAILGSGCDKPQKPQKAPQIRRPLDDLRPKGTSQLTPEQQKVVVATVGPIKITLGDLEAHLNRQPRYIRARFQTLEQKKKLLDDLVRFEALALEAKVKGFDKNPDVVQVMKRMMVSKLLLSELRDRVKLSDISDDEVRKLYDKNINEFKQDARVRLSQIVVKTKEEAEKVLKEIKDEVGTYRYRTQQIFRMKAKKYSTDMKTKALGGDMRYFTANGPVQGNPNTLSKELIAEGFKLARVNDLAGPIKADDGYHILLLTHKRPKINREFNTVKRYLQSRIFRDRRLESRTKYIEAVKTKAKIEIFDKNLSLLKAPSILPSRGLDLRNMRMGPHGPLRMGGHRHPHPGGPHGPGMKVPAPKSPTPAKQPESKTPAPEKKPAPAPKTGEKK